MIPLDPESKDTLFINITNIGRRPVYVRGCFAIMKNSVKGERKIHISSVSGMLKESEWILGGSDDLSIFSPNLKEIYVNDSTGKRWKMSRENLVLLFEDLRNLKSSDKK